MNGVDDRFCAGEFAGNSPDNSGFGAVGLENNGAFSAIGTEETDQLKEGYKIRKRSQAPLKTGYWNALEGVNGLSVFIEEPPRPIGEGYLELLSREAFDNMKSMSLGATILKSSDKMNYKGGYFGIISHGCAGRAGTCVSIGC